jgi:hypothetical protein
VCLAQVALVALGTLILVGRGLISSGNRRRDGLWIIVIAHPHLTPLG